jgi:rod shape-determining protein MreC
MRNLRIFIIKNYFFFLFLIFQLVSLSLLVSGNDYQRTSFLNSSNELVGYIMAKKSEITDYIHLKESNQQLMNENAFLHGLLKETKYEISKGQIEINDTNLKQQYTYLPARVINSTVSMQDNYFTLERGSSDKVRENMGVTDGFSIVGVVIAVSEHYSTVMSVLNKNFSLSVKLKKTNDFGLLKWEGRSNKTATIFDVPADANVEIGDTVVTSGASARFPMNILVGVVSEVTLSNDAQHHLITLKLATNFNSVHQVYVIDNAFAKEQIELENQIITPQ